MTINPQTGTIDVTDVHINACAVKDDDLFTIGRSLQRSNVPQVVIARSPKMKGMWDSGLIEVQGLVFGV